jgi:hypothetical protein
LREKVVGAVVALRFGDNCADRVRAGGRPRPPVAVRHGSYEGQFPSLVCIDWMHSQVAFNFGSP